MQRCGSCIPGKEITVLGNTIKMYANFMELEQFTVQQKIKLNLLKTLLTFAEILLRMN